MWLVGIVRTLGQLGREGGLRKDDDRGVFVVRERQGRVRGQEMGEGGVVVGGTAQPPSS